MRVNYKPTIEQLEQRQLLSSAIAGSIFYDANGDGMRERADPGLASWVVYIDKAGTGQYSAGDPVAIAASNGKYRFAGLRPGTFSVRLLSQIPDGYAETAPKMSDVLIVTLKNGQTVSGKDFGIHLANSAPISPDSLKLTLVNNTQVQISFVDRSNDEGGFTVFRATSASGPWSPIATLPANPGSGTVLYTDTTTTPLTSYLYRVNSFNAFGSSPVTQIASIATSEMPVILPTLDSPGNWHLNFNDGFDIVNTNTWTDQYWWAGNAGTQTTFNSSQIAAVNGVLNITASRQDATANNGVTNPYLSGMLSTGGVKNGKAAGFTFTYGYVESRSKMAGGQGMWNAMWMLPADYNDNYELDIFENLGRAPNTDQSFYHYGPVLADGSFTPSNDLTANWHTYGMDWEPDHITWYLDGVAVHKFASPAAIINRPMYLLMNLDVGGDWAGLVDATSPAQSTWQIDYLRVWQH